MAKKLHNLKLSIENVINIFLSAKIKYFSRTSHCHPNNQFVANNNFSLVLTLKLEFENMLSKFETFDLLVPNQ